MSLRQHVLQMAWLTDTNGIPQDLSSIEDGAVLHGLSPRDNNINRQLVIETLKIRQYILQTAWLTDTIATPQIVSSVQGGVVVQPIRPRHIS